MRYFVLTDIHSNTEALSACITRARDLGYDRALCCGDIVGYGPEPCETVDMMRELNPVCIRGNHDRVASGMGEPDNFNTVAKAAIQWTRDQLQDSHREYLAKLPMGPLVINEECQIAHGALTHEDDYIVEPSDAFDNLLLAQRRITFYGHTHQPTIFALNPIGSRSSSRVRRVEGQGTVALDAYPAMFINAGSVGQPRDGDTRAAFAIWDADAKQIEFHRVTYAFSETQAKMRKANLPPHLINRLAAGR